LLQEKNVKYNSSFFQAGASSLAEQESDLYNKSVADAKRRKIQGGGVDSYFGGTATPN
jgi:hypothetical protein